MKSNNDGAHQENSSDADKRVWETFQKKFSQVQTILDHNRILIREINQNHESKIPENLTRNVALIRELNANIARVVQLYSELSSEFVQSVSENSGEPLELPNMSKVDIDATQCPTSAGQKKPRHE